MTLFLDASALIYWMEASEPFYGRVLDAMRRARERDKSAKVAVSRLSHLECLVGPLRSRDAGLARKYRTFFSASGLGIVEMDADMMERAAHLRATVRGLRTPDAIQSASALALQGEVLFLTGNPVFKKVPGLNVLLV